MPKAIVVGSINMDVVVFVDKHPKIGETIFGKKLKYFPGGKGSNQAIACKRLGCDTLMIGRVGNDNLGEQMLNVHSDEGIDTTGIKKLEKAPTGTAFITVNDSDNSIIVIPGANSAWDKNFTNDLNISKDDIILAQFEIPDWVIKQAFLKAKACGAKTILNPAPVRSVDQEILNATDILVVNEIELQEISKMKIDTENDESIFEAAEKLLANNIESILVTLGNKGVRLLSKNQRKKIDAKIVSAVDTTGAGDCFIGGLTAGLLADQDLESAAKLGNLAASISVTREGAASSLPTLDEVNDIINRKDKD